RDRRKRDRRSNRLMAGHAEECARSERATYVCWHDWLSSAEAPALRTKARAMSATARSMLERMSREERAAFTPQMLDLIRSEFSGLSARGTALAIGAGFPEPW